MTPLVRMLPLLLQLDSYTSFITSSRLCGIRMAMPPRDPCHGVAYRLCDAVIAWIVVPFVVRMIAVQESLRALRARIF